MDQLSVDYFNFPSFSLTFKNN